MNDEIKIIEYNENLDNYIDKIPVVLLPKKISWAKFRKGELYQALMESLNLNYGQIVTILKKAAQRKIVEYDNSFLIVKRSESHV